jgi:tetratricopeptide (TPR) repeat protein
MSELDPFETSVQVVPSRTTSIGKKTNFRKTDEVAGPVYRGDQQLEALRDFDSDSNRADLQSLLGQALLLIDNGDYRLAQAIIRRLLERDPYFSEAIKWQAYCFRQLGDFENGIRCALAFSRLVPGEDSYCQLADFYYQVGRDQEAIANYEKALGVIEYESPHLFEIYKNIGNICLKAGNVDAAEENYNRAFTLSPHSDALLVNFGTLEIQRNNLRGATDRFRQALELNQNNDKAWVGLALVNRKKGDNDLAWGALERALDLAPTNETALSLAIQWGIDDWRFETPIRRLTDYVGQNGQDSNMSYSLAALLYKAGHIRDASIEVERTLVLEPGRQDAQELRTLIRARQ